MCNSKLKTCTLGCGIRSDDRYLKLVVLAGVEIQWVNASSNSKQSHNTVTQLWENRQFDLACTLFRQVGKVSECMGSKQQPVNQHFNCSIDTHVTQIMQMKLC